MALSLYFLEHHVHFDYRGSIWTTGWTDLSANQSTKSPLQISSVGQVIDKKLCSECMTSDKPSLLTWSERVKTVFFFSKTRGKHSYLHYFSLVLCSWKPHFSYYSKGRNPQLLGYYKLTLNITVLQKFRHWFFLGCHLIEGKKERNSRIYARL